MAVHVRHGNDQTTSVRVRTLFTPGFVHGKERQACKTPVLASVVIDSIDTLGERL